MNLKNKIVVSLIVFSLALFLLPAPRVVAEVLAMDQIEAKVVELQAQINYVKYLVSQQQYTVELVTKDSSIGAAAAVKKAVDYINKNMLSAGMTASFDPEVKEESGLYKFKLIVQSQKYDSYVTRDGKLLFAQGIPQAIKLDEPVESEKPASVAKTDKPDVKIFVMTYCPYGLQAQKMYLPVYDLLKDKAAMGVYFVNYAMHGKKEVDENLRQYCIQKEQTDKYAAYLKCFTANAPTASDGTADFTKCLTSAGIDQDKLNTCATATDKQFKITADYDDKSTWAGGSFPKFAVNDDLNTKYNVQGSPTVIVNGQDASSLLNTRSPEALKGVICAAFNKKPAECDTVLSSDLPSTGFGAESSAATASSGGCGN